MIGLIIAGHGEFATGIYDATEVIVGSKENFKKVFFKKGMGVDTLRKDLKINLDSLLLSHRGVVILTDLKGGTPFNISRDLANNYENVEVIAGVNLPIAIEASMRAELKDDPKKLVDYLAGIGKSGIAVAKLSADTASNHNEDKQNTSQTE